MKKNVVSGMMGVVPVCLGAAVASAAVEVPERPNVIFVLADDLGYGDLSCYGQRHFETPNIDALARSGVRFTQAYTTSPVSAPARCGFLTGRDSGHAYIRGNREVEGGQEPLRAGTQSVATMLKGAGYVTGCIGKWGLGPAGSVGEPNKQGFDYFYGYLDQVVAHTYYPTFLWRNEERVDLTDVEEDKGDIMKRGRQYAGTLIGAEAVRFVRENKDRNFFLYFTPTIPHAGMEAPAKYVERFKGKFPEKPTKVRGKGAGRYAATDFPNATYAAMVTLLDEQIGDLVAALKECGIEKKTLIVFTSDNGPSGEGGNDPIFLGSAGELRAKSDQAKRAGGKGSVYEGGVRMPFIVSWPGKVCAGRESGHVLGHWDFMSTVAELLKVEAPANEGVSFAAELLERGTQKEHAYLYWEYEGRQAVRLGDWKGVRWRPVKGEEATKLELYDLKTDVGETKDLATEQPEVVGKILGIMKEARVPSEFAEWNFGG